MCWRDDYFDIYNGLLNKSFIFNRTKTRKRKFILKNTTHINLMSWVSVYIIYMPCSLSSTPNSYTILYWVVMRYFISINIYLFGSIWKVLIYTFSLYIRMIYTPTYICNVPAKCANSVSAYMPFSAWILLT